jgi:uncharacterized membrane protein
MPKPLWYSFYIAVAIGVILGAAIRVGTSAFNFNFPDPISQSIALFHLGKTYGFYFTIISYIAVVGAVLLVAYKLTKMLSDSGENGILVMGLGFFGGLIFIAGLIGFVSIIGLVLLFIGVALTLRIEQEPPGSPPKERSKPFDPFG